MKQITKKNYKKKFLFLIKKTNHNFHSLNNVYQTLLLFENKKLNKYQKIVRNILENTFIHKVNLVLKNKDVQKKSSSKKNMPKVKF